MERLNWSWINAWNKVRFYLGTGVILGLIFGIIAKITIGHNLKLTGLLIYILILPIGTAIIDMVRGGLRLQIVGRIQHPNQGFIGSIRSMIIVSLLGGLLSGLFGRLFDMLTSIQMDVQVGMQAEGVPFRIPYWLLFGLLTGLSFGWTCGGAAAIQHTTLRLLLARAGLAPLRYAAFLDHAASRVLLRRVGGGWVFVHRVLLDYFAGLAPGLGVVSEQDGEEKR